MTEQVWQNIRPHLSAYVGGHVFKELCQEWIYHLANAGALPFFPQRVGAFWGARKPQTRGEPFGFAQDRLRRTIDVLAISEDDHATLLGKCMWAEEPMHVDIVSQFLEQAPRVIPDPAERWDVAYAFFSRSNSTDDAWHAPALTYL